MSRKNKVVDSMGNTYWESENGNREYERTDCLGDKYREDSGGGRTYERKDWLGNTYRESPDGNREYEKTDWLGNTYREDNHGNRTYEQTDWFGNKYEAKENSGGGCYLTTACVEYAGLPDDCYELQLLRKFRDHVVMRMPNGPAMVLEYYAHAPEIVHAIKKSKAANSELAQILCEVRDIASTIESGSVRIAIWKYRAMYNRLCTKYL